MTTSQLIERAMVEASLPSLDLAIACDWHGEDMELFRLTPDFGANQWIAHLQPEAGRAIMVDVEALPCNVQGSILAKLPCATMRMGMPRYNWNEGYEY